MVQICHNKGEKSSKGFEELKRHLDLTRAYALYNYHHSAYMKSLDGRINNKKERMKKFIYLSKPHDTAPNIRFDDLISTLYKSYSFLGNFLNQEPPTGRTMCYPIHIANTLLDNCSGENLHMNTRLIPQEALNAQRKIIHRLKTLS